jgi:hypothetical protein
MKAQSQPSQLSTSPQPLLGWHCCFSGMAPAVNCYWPYAYCIAYQMAVEQIHEGQLRRQWWEPNLN